MKIQRPDVAESGRVSVTRRLVARSGAQAVLEVGGGDLSFRDALPQAQWMMLDFAGDADVIVDLNVPQPSIPLQDSTFDLVVMTEVLEHLLWPHRTLVEVRRLLKPSGQLIISVPNISSASYRIAWLLGRVPSCAACGNLPPPDIGPTTYQIAGGGEIGGHVIDFNGHRVAQVARYAGYSDPEFHSSGLFWHRQVVPPALCPASLGSNLIAVMRPLSASR